MTDAGGTRGPRPVKPIGEMSPLELNNYHIYLLDELMRVERQMMRLGVRDNRALRSNGDAKAGSDSSRD